MRKDKILYDIKEAIRAYNKDAKITNAYILHLVNTIRAKYIRQNQRRNPGEDKVNHTQTLLLDLELVDNSYLPAFPTDVTILRTVKVLPQLVGKDVLKNVEVRSINRIAQEIEYMDKVRAIYAADELFVFAFLDDDHKLYLVNKSDNLHKTITKVAVTAILFEPDAITEINDLTEELEEYPMPAHLWAQIKPEILVLIKDSMQIPIDQVEDNQTIQ